MQRRLHRALIESSELTAFIVLVILLIIRTWRRVERTYRNSPSVIELLERYHRWVDRKIYYLLYYDQAHWI